MKNVMMMFVAMLMIAGNAIAQGKKCTGAKKNPELKKELKAYKEANVTPVLKAAHSEMDRSFNGSDLQTVNALRAENNILSAKHKEFRKKIKAEMKGAEDREAIKAKYATEIEAHRAEKKDLMMRLKPVIESNKEMLAGIFEELKPQREVWKTETRAILEKYMTAEEIEQCKSKKGKPGMQGERPNRPHTEGKPELGDRSRENASGDRPERRGEGRRGHAKHGGKKLVAFVLWDGESRVKDMEDTGFQIENRKNTKPSVGQNYPNPAGNSTTIEFNLPVSTDNLNVLITDMQGKVVRRYNFESLNQGQQSLDLNLRGLNSGTYLYTIEGEGFKETKKMSIAQ